MGVGVGLGPDSTPCRFLRDDPEAGGLVVLRALGPA